MKTHRKMVLAAVLCASALFSTLQAQDDHAARSKDETPAVTIRLGSLTITNTRVELRCEIQNNAQQDIWVHDGIPHGRDHNSVRGTNAEVYLDKEGQTLLILRRMNLPLHGMSTAPRVGTYARLRVGESRPCVFVVVLPIVVEYHDLRGLSQAIRKGTEYLPHLAFQIGYYIREELRSVHMVANPFGRIYVESEDRLQLHEDPPWITYAERAAAVKMEGLRIPIGQWIVIEEEGPERRPSDERADRVFERYWQLSGKLREVFHEDVSPFPFPPEEYRYANRLFRFDPDLYDEPARQVADVFIQLAERKLSPSELTQRLDAILSRPDREKLLDELSRKRTLAGAPQPVQPTSLEALRDLFYNFSLDLEQYQYARQLFAIEKGLLDDSAKRLVDVYVQVAEGKLGPAELTRCLDEILSKTDRAKLLESLQKRQSAGTSPDNGE